MRKNLPITKTEFLLQPDQSLISRTDSRGMITYVNRAFVEVSGFSERELIGAPHNIVRHPDMPVEAFADMWETLKSGRAWTGMVKNRRKNGDHYWVQADATPIRVDGAIAGYTSVRIAPSREQVAAAEAAYARFRKGEAKGLSIRHGQVVRTGPLGVLASLRRPNIARRLALTLAASCAITIVLALLCLTGLAAEDDSVENLYHKRITAVAQFDQVIRQLNRDQIALLEAIGAKRPGDAPALRERVKSATEGVDRALLQFQSHPLLADEQKLGQRLHDTYLGYLQEGLTPVLDALAQGDSEGALRLYGESLAPAFIPVRKNIDELLELQLSRTRQEVDDDANLYVRARNGVVGALMLAIVFAIVSGIYLTRSIVRPLAGAVGLAKQIAACNLTADIQHGAEDETGELLHALNVMKLSLTNIVSGVRRNAESVASSAAEIAGGNADLSARTEQQAANLEETAASMEELTSTVTNNASHSAEAGQLAEDANRTAQAGGGAMDKVVGSMQAISDSAKRITDIISVIDSIAFQTNILSLNAAVEAARAGEHGRGFAVVASEVRNLAQRSASAAKEIKALITASVGQIELGSAEVNVARGTMDNIIKSVDQVSQIMADITLASREQQTGIEQVGAAVMSMDEATQQNAALVEEAAAASSQLQQFSQELLQDVGVFKLTPANAIRIDQGHKQQSAAAVEENWVRT